MENQNREEVLIHLKSMNDEIKKKIKAKNNAGRNDSLNGRQPREEDGQDGCLVNGHENFPKRDDDLPGNDGGTSGRRASLSGHDT
jgi:hypothetical protein